MTARANEDGKQSAIMEKLKSEGTTYVPSIQTTELT